MIVFNEGLSGAGKTYDAIVTHLVPAARAGRMCYHNIRGVDPAAIAAYIGKEPEDVEENLHYLDNAEIASLGELVRADSLVIIDECHEHFVASRNALPPDQEKLFAMHRHAGLDIVLISQAYKRVHSAVRVRIERKWLFRKLNAVGLDTRYVAILQSALGPDRFDEVTKETRKYDPAIFALYQSVAPGTDNLALYSAAGGSVFSKKFVAYCAAAVVVAFLGIMAFKNSFDADNYVREDEKKAEPVKAAATANNRPNRPTPSERIGQGTPGERIAKAAKGDAPKRAAGIGYVLDLGEDARPRLAATLDGMGRSFEVIEWRDEQMQAVDRLTSEQLQDMGWTVERTTYGVHISGDGEAFIATSWPLEDFASENSERARDTPTPSVSEPSAVPPPTRAPAFTSPPTGVPIDRFPMTQEAPRASMFPEHQRGR